MLVGSDSRWLLSWKDTFPCTHMSVAGEGFRRVAFVSLMREVGVLPPGPVAPQPVPTPVAGGVLEFIAVFDVARGQDDLDPSTRELIATAGPNVTVADAGCWDGLPRKLGVGRSFYVAAVVAPTEEELEAAIQRVGREPIFRDRIVTYCVD